MWVLSFWLFSFAFNFAGCRFRHSSLSFVLDFFHGLEHCCLIWCVGRTQRTNECPHAKVLRSCVPCQHYDAFAMTCGQTHTTYHHLRPTWTRKRWLAKFTADASLPPATQARDCKETRKLSEIQIVQQIQAPSRQIRPVPPAKSVHGHDNVRDYDFSVRIYFDWAHVRHHGHQPTKAIDGHLPRLWFRRVYPKRRQAQ